MKVVLPEGLARSRFIQRAPVAWVVTVGLALLGVGFIFTWLEQPMAAPAAWLWLTTVTLAGGVVLYLYQHHNLQLTVCSIKPQVLPLQVSCLAAQALGIQLLWYTESPYFVALLPFLAWPGWPYFFILSGVAGLGWLSLWCNCRDELLLKADR